MSDIYNKLALLKIKDVLIYQIQYIVKYIFSPKFRCWQKNPPINPKFIMQARMEKILRFCEYAGISYSKFFDIAKTKVCGGNFNNYENENDFYANWKIDDTALNIFYQIAMYQKYYAYIYNYFNNKKIKYCDYGCGSATNSLCLYDLLTLEEMHLYDVENTTSKYLKDYIEKYKLKNVKWFDVENTVTNFVEYYDLIMCCDVLEHLRNPSEIIQRLYKMLKPNGYLILAAPFEYRDNAEHIEAAPIDFYNNGGYKFLKTNFNKVRQLNQKLHISGVYRKKG